MKLHGRPLTDTPTCQVELPRPDGNSLVLTLRPLPLGFHRRLRERGITAPMPPTRVARESNGTPLRDRQGLALLVADESDRDYLSELELYHQRVAVLVAAEALRADPHVEFETPFPESSADWRRYADALYGELEEAGWSAGDLIRLCHEVCRLSNLTDEHLRAAHENFSPPGLAIPP